ncbi:MAG: hypothetical protein M1816_002350 [Peltula sp. TS41687]|nr:MAG: hypothetical protein M1816_002350 [Peltula sp. TS41687]
MTILHLVLLQFKEGKADQGTIKETIDRLMRLKDQCLHPTTNAPYIKSLVGGITNSVEGLENGHTHGFLMEFENEEHRNFYAKEDPVHVELLRDLGGREVLEKLTVLDFTPGVFGP